MLASYAPASAPLLVALNLTALSIGVTISAALGGRVLDRAGPGALPAAGVIFSVAALVLLLWSYTKRGRSVRAEPTSC